MNSSIFSWLYTVIFSYLLTACLSSTTPISYAEHCNSIVPESTLDKFEPVLTPFDRLHSGYYVYNGGGTILSEYSSEGINSLSLRIRNVRRTDKDGVFGIEGSLSFQSLSTYGYVGGLANTETYYTTGVLSEYHPMVLGRTGSLSFRLHGFWSESSGQLCMVGTGFSYSRKGKGLNLDAVLKLSNFTNSSSITSLVTGTLQSSSSSNDLSYFGPISIMIVPIVNYEYTLVSKESGDEDFSGGNDSVKSLPFSALPIASFCSVISRAVYRFDLKYTSNSEKFYGPFGAAVGYLPTLVFFKDIVCLEEEKKLRVLIQFPSSSYVRFYQPFSPNTTLIGEGMWNDKMNQLFIVACKFLNTTVSLANAQVGDCTIRLRLSFPAIWSIRETSIVVGQIWSKKAVNDSGYFNKIQLRSTENPFGSVQGFKYDYTEMNRVRSSCPSKGKKNKGVRYPNVYSRDMQFDIRVRGSKGNSTWGYVTPLSIGDRFYEQYLYPRISPSGSRIPKSVVQAQLRDSIPVNISYKISIKIKPGETLYGTVYPYVISSRNYEKIEISAEGIYDAETGQLCMVGCRHISWKNQSFLNNSIDCEILITLRFPPSNPKKNGGYIKGSIKSTRVKSDPLYFEPLDVSSASYTVAVARDSIYRMDLEIFMALLTNTLACVFVALQLFHVKKHPDVLPFISLAMLLILTLGHMIPLMLNFEAMFLQNRERQNVVLGSGGLVEVNEVLVRIITMVAFLFEVRLLQLSWSSKQVDANQKGQWFAEKSTLLLSSILYAAGALIFLFVNLGKLRNYSLWDDLKSYAGLVLDGFLLPQILLNGFRNSRRNALSCSFYIGTTFVRLLPHAYDLYRTQSYNRFGSYFYAEPSADFYSTAGDVIIPLGGLMLAAIIYLQQRFGGRCLIPRRNTIREAYETVPVASEAELPEKSSASDGVIPS